MPTDQTDPTPSSQTIFSHYLEFTKNQVSPTNFHFWVCASLVAGVLERRVWVDQYYYKVFPNLYVVLTSDSALCAKTTALEIGVNGFLRPLRDLKGSPQTYIISDELTPQFLYEAISSQGSVSMVRHPGRHILTRDGIQVSRPAYLFTGELGMMFTEQAVRSNIIEKLTHLYTCPPIGEYNTRTAGHLFVYNPCLNLLSAVTPDWLERNIDKNRYGEGLMGRMVFPYSSSPREINFQPRPIRTSETEHHRAPISAHLERIAALKGAFRWDPSAGTEFDQWNYSHRKELKNREKILDVLASGFWGRQADLVISIAMILSVGQDSSLVLSKLHIEESIAHVTLVRSQLVYVFSPAATTGADPFVSRVESFIQRKGRATRSEITKAMGRFMKSAVSGEALTRLVSSGRIKKTKTLGGGDRFEAIA